MVFYTQSTSQQRTYFTAKESDQNQRKWYFLADRTICTGSNTTYNGWFTYIHQQSRQSHRHGYGSTWCKQFLNWGSFLKWLLVMASWHLKLTSTENLSPQNKRMHLLVKWINHINGLSTWKAIDLTAPYKLWLIGYLG